MHSPACRHTGSSQTRGTTKNLRQEKGVGTRAPLLPTSRTGASWKHPGSGGSTPQPEWQGLEVPREQPLTPGRL